MCTLYFLTLTHFFFDVQYVLGLDNLTNSTKFDLEEAVRSFHNLVKPSQNLLLEDLVSIVC